MLVEVSKETRKKPEVIIEEAIQVAFNHKKWGEVTLIQDPSD